MKPLLVLAGNAQQAQQWIYESKDILETLQLDAKYIYPKDINYLKYRDGYFILVGTVSDAGYPPEMFAVFDSHNIVNFNL